MNSDTLETSFNAYVAELNRAKWVEALEIAVTAQGGEFSVKYEHQLDYDRIDGICVNYLPDASDEKSGEIVEFKIDNESVFFDKGLGLDFITARDHLNLTDRFFRVSKKIDRDENIQITIKDTTTGAFTAYVRKFYLLMSKPV
ncbi:hypothetical protein [Chondrinema litorale]|uniref:hypothetical protein n=1 Tax=Chondrinema litorale TaxID=2994555 RepID=UPI0025430500|nr:hypothetical protein [Chondrinema litorale]UZR95319.1 hypothetical protein OQ292_05730 [Chondrinema litorale]